MRKSPRRSPERLSPYIKFMKHYAATHTLGRNWMKEAAAEWRGLSGGDLVNLLCSKYNLKYCELAEGHTWKEIHAKWVKFNDDIVKPELKTLHPAWLVPLKLGNAQSRNFNEDWNPDREEVDGYYYTANVCKHDENSYKFSPVTSKVILGRCIDSMKKLEYYLTRGIKFRKSMDERRKKYNTGDRALSTEELYDNPEAEKRLEQMRKEREEEMREQFRSDPYYGHIRGP